MIIGVLFLAVVAGLSIGGIVFYLGVSFWMVLAVYSGAGTALILGMVALAALCELTKQGDTGEAHAGLTGAQFSKGRYQG